MAPTRFNSASFLLRWLVALILVFATFNPTGFSYYSWVVNPSGDNVPVKVAVGIVLLILYVIYLRATWRAIGLIGVILASALMTGLIWVTIDIGLLDLNKSTIVTWVILFAFATVLAIGISWSHVRHRVTGQTVLSD